MSLAPPYIDEAAVFDLVSWSDAVAALERALLDGLDPASTPQRSIIGVEHGQLLFMPAETGNGVGVKLGTVAPGNPRLGLPRVNATYLLYDAVTLGISALMDGTALTTLRTPAVSAVAVKHLAVPDAQRLVVFGSGPQGWGHIEAIRAVRPIREVTVVGRDRDRAEALAARARFAGVTAHVGGADAVGKADVVACATTARVPLFDGSLLQDHACTVAVGSHEPQARELDSVTMRCARRVVVEDPTVAMREGGDVIRAVQDGDLQLDDLIGLADAVRLQPDVGRSVFKSVGMGWQDLVVAQLVHSRWTQRRDD